MSYQPALSRIASITSSLCACRSLDSLDEIVRSEISEVFSADELIVDVSSSDLSRPALIRVNVDDRWAKLYNSKFHQLNPVLPSLKALLKEQRPIARRFADLCPEPISETRFFQEYMLPQRHQFSAIGTIALGEASNLVPALTILVVRYEGKTDFNNGELVALEILTLATAWGIHCAMRSSDAWSMSVIKAAFSLPPKLATVAFLISKGMSNNEIATALAITLGTTKHYVHQILEATGASSRADLCRMILA